MQDSFSATFRSAVFGFIIGDALGVPYEFTKRVQMIRQPATDMIGNGTYDQPAGTWSDDTSMLLCVIENTINKGSVEDLASLFVRWYKEGYLTSSGELFDIGNTTQSALEQVIKGIPAQLAGLEDEFSGGNGSLMRCLPYAFTKDIEKDWRMMQLENNITHRHWLCHWCCVFYVKALRTIIDGGSKLEAIASAGAFLSVTLANEVSEAESVKVLNALDRLLQKDFADILEEDIQSTGFVLHTLEAACWCFLNTDNYKDAVLEAVNLGGDTDTIAAITGGLAGAYYGYNNIPVSWVNQLINKSLVEELLGRFSHGNA